MNCKSSRCRQLAASALIAMLGLLGRALAEEQASAGKQTQAAPDSPLSPEDSLSHFQLAPGLRIEVAVAEPEVIDPVAIRFDERGRMWVVEMGDYPHGPSEGEEPKSRIKILEDRDGDGRYESATVFADKLLFATGLQPWMGGVIVTMAGKVAFMKDTDGNGHADLHETLYTGFAEENSQLRANHPRLALDNHIYIANGLRGGTIVNARLPDTPPVSISGMDFRFDPFTGECEAVSGVGQFGLTFDDWGNRFVCSNRNPLKHIVIEDRFLKKNPLAKIPAVAHDVAKAGEESRIFPISRAWTTSNLHAGQFTAACGCLIYRGDALPESFYGNAFTCDPTGNLVHREIIKPDGATFTSKPAREGVEFLASRDEWFRPVNLENGPDGALYVVDMYRAVIEHPQFVPDELKRRPDLLLGNDRGRVYRITSAQSERKNEEVNVADATGAELVALFTRRSAWWRETAQRLLVERQDKSAVEQLRTLAESEEQATARVHALWTLRGLGELEPYDIAHWLDEGKNPAPVVEQLVKLAEPYANRSVYLRKLLRRQVQHEKVHFHAVLALAPAQTRSEASNIGGSAFRDERKNDPWFRHAAAIFVGPMPNEAGMHYFADPFRETLGDEADMELLKMFYALSGADRSEGQAQEALQQIASVRDLFQRSRDQRAALLGLCQGARQLGRSLPYLLNKADADVARGINEIVAESAKLAGDDSVHETIRVEAIQLLGEAGDREESLIPLARDERNRSIRQAAITALAKGKTDEPWKDLLKSFSSESPAIRGALLDAMLASASRTQLLLEAIEAGAVKLSEVDINRRNRLLKHGNQDIRGRAEKLFADAVPADRQEVLADYQAALKLTADATRGIAVFKKNCSQCHRVGDVGIDVAPDISDSRTKQPAQILTDIIQPNRAIDANFISYIVATNDGRILTGILTSETATSITLKQPEGNSETLLRSEIEELRSTGVSLMPDGLEKDIPHQDMADLIAYIKHWRYLDGRTPLSPSEEQE